jgi:hypothetical protein
MIATRYLFRCAAALAAFSIGNFAFAGVEYFRSDKYSYMDEKCRSELIHPAEASSTFESLYNYDNWNVSGEYYLMDEALMKGFPDFDYFEIEVRDEGGLPMPTQGAVHGKREHKFKSVSLSGDRLGFETEAIRGVSYRFSGTIGLDTADPTSDRVLRGNFTKLQNGKTVGWMYATFYPGGDC